MDTYGQHAASSSTGASGSSANTTSASSLIIPPTDHLHQALQTVLQASRDFVTPDPAVRARGEEVFLQVRKAENAIEYAAFFIGELDSHRASRVVSLITLARYCLPQNTPRTPSSPFNPST